METKIKILIIEDDVVTAMAEKSIFQGDVNCQIEVARSGSEAIKLTSTNAYDLIMMDLGLGDTTGYAVTEQIRANGMNIKTVIVALTAHTKEAVEAECLKVGMNGVESKPLLPGVAKRIVSEFIPQLIAQ